MIDAPLSMDHLYAETCTNIRATDEIRFKLMGFVPLVSGAALSAFFSEGINPFGDELPLGCIGGGTRTHW